MEPQRCIVDRQTAGEYILHMCTTYFNLCFQILRDYFIVCNQVFFVTVLCVMWRLSFQDGNDFHPPEDGAVPPQHVGVLIL